jgi:hypothetical protein
MLRRIMARAPTYWADARQDPKWVLMFLFGRLLPVRRLLWPKRPMPIASSDGATSLFPTTAAAALADLRSNGLHTGFTLPCAIVADIRAFAEEHECYANFSRTQPFLPARHREIERELGKPVLTGQYLDSIETCRAVRLIRSDPLIVATAASYLGSAPKPISTRLWWSFPTQGVSEEDLSHASQGKMHFDLDDWRTVKFFFYITSVGPADGPHVYIRHSHRQRRLRHQLTLVVGHETTKVVEAYGQTNVTTLTGEAGFGFAEDSFGFHMGQVPRAAPRLMLEIGFGVSAAPSRRFHGDLVLH